ncbi:protein-arginine deiminase family protein [Desulfobacter curvatus]|uniref:protein-arginine deiminase family protein n=1 Tax=Desulfobacter curvatus TaxID=2290 RepID=UPI000364F1FD|nr:protein-arginine deiminase family protein [Desulfobacter curvatus]
MCLSGCNTKDQKKPSEGKNASAPKDCVKVKCPLATLIVLVRLESDGSPIDNTSVEIKGVGTKLTQKDGKATFEKINPGKYEVKARKDGHIPDSAETNVELAENSKKEITLELELLELHMHVDADRDGKVDNDWEDNKKWEPGKGKKGAVILCNNDDEDSDKKEDNKNQKVDTATDLPDLAPLVLRKKPKGKKFPAGWKAKLEVSDEKKIRVFDKRADGGVEKIGPDTGKKAYEIKDLTPDEHELCMEATTYPEVGFDGIITLKLSLIDDKGTIVHTEEAKVRVAPWLMFNHAYVTTKVYVVETTDNVNFRSKLANEIPSGVTIETASKAVYGTDRWMQDAMEPGFASMPNSSAKDKWNVPATLRTFNDRPGMGWGPIDGYPKNELLGPGYGFLQAAPPGMGNSLDSFGNLECSPPFTHKTTKREYKFGRIVYGGGGSRTMEKKVREFLEKQKVQEPFEVDTDWLIVGHVDEVFSFLPLPGNKYKVLLASTKVAMDIVNKNAGTAKLLQGIDFPSGTTQANVDAKYKFDTVDDITKDANFKKVQTDVQKNIEGLRKVLKTELGLEDTDFVHLPVLFMEDGGRYVAYTPGVVNMLVVTKSAGSVKLCIPKPFGPIVGGKCQFEEDIKTKLKAEGLNYPNDFKFIDDFTTYHMLFGEIHCGTNSQRTPPDDQWWWEMDWI